MVRVSGIVSEVAARAYRVAGLSRFVNLGETVSSQPEPAAARRGHADRRRSA